MARGLDMGSFRVVADFPIDGVAAGQNLAAKFQPKSSGVWELKLSQPIARLRQGQDRGVGQGPSRQHESHRADVLDWFQMIRSEPAA